MARTIKVIKHSCPRVNHKASAAKGVLVYQHDENNQVIVDDVFYRYAYVELWGTRGNTNKKKSRALSFYADAGMGNGGTGGYVAAAIDNKLITKKDALDAYHLGPVYYTSFIEHCKVLLESTDSTDYKKAD